MTKVAVLVDTWFPFVGGGQISAYEISRRIAGEKIQIDIITRNCGTSKASLPKGMKVVPLGKPQKVDSIFSKLMYLARAYAYLHKNKYDLVHAHAYLPGFLARACSLTSGVPTIFSVHGTSLVGNYHPRFQFIEKFILTGIRYSAQITVSRDFLQIKNVNENVLYIPNASLINWKKTQKKSKKKINTFLTVARLHPQKNLSNYLLTLNKLKEKTGRFKALIVGNGPEENNLKNLTKKLNLSKNVFFLGEKELKDLKKLYQTADIFILPSIFEGQSIALLDSFAAKLPVIVTTVGDNPFLIKDGINGFLIKSNFAPEDLSELILKVIDKDLNRIALKGYNLLKENFSWDKSAKQTSNLYEKLLRSSN